jgi:small subunit ribosomal protein S11
MAKSTSKKRKVIVDTSGEAHINASFNNIIISITNLKGEVISWSSAGKMGFRGSKRSFVYGMHFTSHVPWKWNAKLVVIFTQGYLLV